MYELHELDEPIFDAPWVFATQAEARRFARKNGIEAYSIWTEDERGPIRVEICDPYTGDDDRVRQALGDAPWEQPS